MNKRIQKEHQISQKWYERYLGSDEYLEDKRFSDFLCNKLDTLEKQLEEQDFLLANIPEKGKELFKENERLRGLLKEIGNLQTYDMDITPYMIGASMTKTTNGNWVYKDDIDDIITKKP